MHTIIIIAGLLVGAYIYTKLGGKQALADQGVVFDSGMPGFGEQLSDQEIRNTLAFIKSKWPEREKQAQATRSKTATE